MMRLFPLAVLVMHISMYSVQAQAPEKRQEVAEGVKKQVIKTYGIKEKFGKYEDEFQVEGIIEYDKSGRKTVETWRTAFGTLAVKVIYRYSDSEQSIEEAGYNEDGSMRYKSVLKHDKKGNKTEKLLYDKDNQILSLKKFDEKGREIEYSSYEKGNLEWRIVYKYHEKWDVITSVTRYNAKGKLTSKEEKKFSKKGDLIEERSDGKVIATLHVNERGQLVEKKGFGLAPDRDGVVEKWGYKYNEKGYLIEKEGYDNIYQFKGAGTPPILKESCKYDEKGNLTEVLLQKKMRAKDAWTPEKKSVYEYEYYNGK